MMPRTGRLAYDPACRKQFQTICAEILFKHWMLDVIKYAVITPRPVDVTKCTCSLSDLEKSYVVLLHWSCYGAW